MDNDKQYFATRAAEEAALAEQAGDPSAVAAHRELQRQYAERASIGDRRVEQREPIG